MTSTRKFILFIMVYFCHEFYDKYLPSYYTKNIGSLTESKIKSGIANGQLFGVLEVDISVKDEFKDFFFGISTLFCTCRVPMDKIGEHNTVQKMILNLIIRGS